MFALLPIRRSLLATYLFANLLCTFAIPGYAQAAPNQKEIPMSIKTQNGATTTDTSIRPFHINIPESELVDLRRRLAATRFPEQETVKDLSQGVPLATMKKLVDKWSKNYDWRKVEAKLNSYPQFITNIDGVDIHFIHVRSKIRTLYRSSSRTDGLDRS